MYSLTKLSDTLWKVQTRNGGTFLGSISQVCTYAMINLGVSMAELDIAISEMAKMEHDIAYFGVRNSFLYTSFDKLKVS